MSWLSDLFKKKEVKQEPSKEPWQLGAGEALSSWGQKYLSQYDPAKAYGGQFTAPMSPLETQGQSWLSKYMGQEGPGKGYQLALDEYQKTLTGGYDPFTSPFYQATRTGAGYELESSIDKMRRGQAARGAYFTDTAMREENVLRKESTNFLTRLLGELQEKERARRTQVMPFGMELEKYKTGLPLEKAKAGITLGTVPRMIEQADLEARYNDFLRKQEGLSKSLGATQGVFGTGMDYGIRNWEAESPFERIMNSVEQMSRIAGNVIPFASPAKKETKKS